jgi:hypothetical protein
MVKDDTLATAMTGLAASINSGAGDPAVFATFEPSLGTSSSWWRASPGPTATIHRWR